MTNEAFDLKSYAEAVKRGPQSAATWLFANSHTIGPELFRTSFGDWTSLTPEHMLALRACAPSEVFIPSAKEDFESAVRENSELTKLASVLFCSDAEMIGRLPQAFKSMKQPLILLMNAAYRKGIRLADPRIPFVE